MLDSFIVRANNIAARLRKKGFRPENVLLLFPRCLQNSECGQNLLKSLGECRRCGKCRVKDMLELAEKFGVRPFIATGGRLALERVKDAGVKAVVAVACEKELKDGIIHALPKLVIAIVNERPHGPCKDTTVDAAKVEQAIREMLR